MWCAKERYYTTVPEYNFCFVLSRKGVNLEYRDMVKEHDCLAGDD
jgi:hypothetical protein